MIVTRELLQQLIDEEFSKAIQGRQKKLDEAALKRAISLIVNQYDSQLTGEDNEQD